MSFLSRITSALAAIAAIVGLVAQFTVSLGLTGNALGAIWAMLGYFTILTNLIVLVTHGYQAVSGRMLGAGWLSGVTLWILIVGVVYHTLLASIWDPQGIALLADQALHTATPVLAALFWLGFAPKAPLPWRAAATWLIWPLGYVIYALIRGSFTGQYPYPFIDLNVLSIGEFTINAIGLCVAFFLGGLALIGIARLLNR